MFIQLATSELIEIDEEDFEKVNKYIWLINNKGYVYTSVENKNITLHSLVLDFPECDCIDHRDHIKLNNKKNNLRVATKTQNGHNRIKQSTLNSSQYKGVSWRKDTKKWAAALKSPIGLKISLGSFNIEKEAALAYNTAAVKYFGEFACINKLD